MFLPRLVLPILLLLLVSTLSQAVPPEVEETAPASRPPNIVLIISDDLGYPYHGFMGNPVVSTPNLDELAAGGTTFTHAYSPASVCRPALQTLLSGIHPREWVAQEHRLEEERGAPLPVRAEVAHYTTIARQLSRQGYRTFQGGKHWEGTFASSGFDAGTTAALDPTLFLAPDWLDFARQSLAALQAFMEDLEEDEPFFLYLAPMLPHTPHNAPFRFVQEYAGRGFVDAAVKYYANTTRFDEVVGRVMDGLDNSGLRENTLIIYLSDNGWEQGAFDPPYFLGNPIGGDRGKLSAYDLGFRTPVVFNWPGEVPDGVNLRDFIGFEDVHATIMNYAGAPIPPDHAGNTLVPRIEGQDEPGRPFIVGVQDIFRAREEEYVSPMIVTFEAASFMRTNQWRYIEWLDRDEHELYAIEVDPTERFNLAANFPGVVADLSARAAQWRSELHQPAAWMDVMGTIQDVNGTPAPGLRLRLKGSRHVKPRVDIEVTSNANGSYRFPNVPAGMYELQYESLLEPANLKARNRFKGSKRKREKMLVDLTDFQTGPFLSLDVAGVVAKTGSPVADAGTIEVALHATDPAMAVGLTVHIAGWTQDGPIKQRVLTGPDGFVAVDQLPPGFYVVRVDAKNNHFAKAKWLRLGAGSIHPLEIDVRHKYERKRKAGQKG